MRGQGGRAAKATFGGIADRSHDLMENKGQFRQGRDVVENKGHLS
jgi:hypothetical protein